MKAVILADGGIELQDMEFGALSHNWVRIRVAKAGLCGSDVMKITAPVLSPWHTRILGHEFYGQIVELDGQTERVSVGDWAVGMPLLSCGVCRACMRGQENLCVQAQAIGRTVQGAFAEFVDVPLTNIIRIVDNGPLDSYTLADPLAVCVHASKIAGRFESPQQCLIIGDGTIGCLLAWLMRIQRHEVWLKGLHEDVLRFVESFGVKTTDEVQPQCFDVVFETVGRAQHHSLNESLRAVRWGGSIIAVGVFAHEYVYPLIARNLFIGEVKLVGANAYLRSEFEEAVRLIEEHGQTLRNFISHRFPLSRFEDALATVQSKQGFTMKIILEMEGLLP